MFIHLAVEASLQWKKAHTQSVDYRPSAVLNKYLSLILTHTPPPAPELGTVGNSLFSEATEARSRPQRSRASGPGLLPRLSFRPRRPRPRAQGGAGADCQGESPGREVVGGAPDVPRLSPSHLLKDPKVVLVGHKLHESRHRTGVVC